jgi:mercuric reductase
MSGKSRWKVDATSRAKAALATLKELWQLDQKIAQLTEDEQAAWRYLIRTYPERGRPAYAEEIQAALKWSDAKAAEQALARLDGLDLLVLEGGLIACIYPYSVSPTLHEIHFPSMSQWQPVYAACAIDALGVSSLVEQEVSVESRCVYCDAPIHIELKGGAVMEAKPETMKLWIGRRYETHSTTSLCASMIFACSDQHLAAWRGKSGEKDGYVVTLGEAAAVAQGLYAGLLPPESGPPKAEKRRAP